MSPRHLLSALALALFVAAPVSALQGPAPAARVGDGGALVTVAQLSDCQVNVGNCTGGSCYASIGTCWDYCTFNVAATCLGNCPWNIAGTCTDDGDCWINVAAACRAHCDLSAAGLCITAFAPLEASATQAGPCLYWVGTECALRIGSGGDPYGCGIAIGGGETELRIFCGMQQAASTSFVTITGSGSCLARNGSTCIVGLGDSPNGYGCEIAVGAAGGLRAFCRDE